MSGKSLTAIREDLGKTLAKKKVLVLGGGFGGVFAAKELEERGRDLIDVELINDNNYFVFQPLLPEVAAGGIHSSDAVVPLRQLLPKVQFRQAEVAGIDFDKKMVIVVQGASRIPVELPYDELIVGLGTTVDLNRFPGLPEHALTMKQVSDAHKLRNHVLSCLERADVATNDAAKRQLMTFVVVGAGFSGVETVGEVNALIHQALRYYPHLTRHDVRVLLVEYADRILPTFSKELADYATQRLKLQGIEVLTGVGTKSATSTAVELTTGALIPTSTIVATIGNGPRQLISSLGLDMKWGRIQTNRFMQVPGQPDVWAVGDAALIPMKDEPGDDPQAYAPQTAQFAVREGKQLADNLLAELRGKTLKPFSYESKGALASLGTTKAVADVYGLKLTGFFAWLLWRGFYLSFIPGFQAKARLLATWLLNVFMPPNLVLIQGPPPATRYIHYRKDDVVFEPGMVLDGFYLVLSGKLKLTIDNKETGEHLVREFGPGGHFGERVLIRPIMRTGLVEALEDTEVLFVAKKDFIRFARDFPVLDDYFVDYIKKTFGGEGKSFAPQGGETQPQLEKSN
ncbi:FAD-dependent oxidoreductase [Methyloligella sp. 2.7D]|uniref:FAD-dependent oxidoreductase n=1 Tax=unclassified Methyloligella TaxID=2625955 RepID=UPI00157DA003|nr:FAD-dependent oxidoreductase [Methyloligella sp. GL2]QKP75981.1 FAD-dependent oxidoreductase [Methyloligella sp. GL2]